MPEIDPGTGLALLGAAIGSKELVQKILGPTADYLGGGLKTWTEKRLTNVARIFEKANKKLGDRIDQPGAVPPKVLKEILDEGSYCDDELTADYFAGVLASSRSDIPRDNRGAVFALLTSRLSNYQIKSHYLFYHALKKVYDGSLHSVSMEAGRNNLKVLIPMGAYFEGMEFVRENPAVILSHVVFGLFSEGLINQPNGYGEPETLNSFLPNMKEAGVVFTPSVLGVEFFLWALGRGDTPPGYFLSPAIKILSSTEIKLVDAAQSV